MCDVHLFHSVSLIHRPSSIVPRPSSIVLLYLILNPYSLASNLQPPTANGSALPSSDFFEMPESGDFQTVLQDFIGYWIGFIEIGFAKWMRFDSDIKFSSHLH